MQIKYCASPHTHSLPSKCIFECCNVLLGNLCIIHSSNQHIPCGGLGTFATTPSGQPFLHCFFIIQGMGTDACISCGLVKPHSFKDCPRFACSFSAHMYSEELEKVWMTCTERARQITSMLCPCTHIHDREHHSPATDDPSCVSIVCSG